MALSNGVTSRTDYVATDASYSTELRAQHRLPLSGHRFVQHNPAFCYPVNTLCASFRENAWICMQATFISRAAAPISGTACVICVDCIAHPRFAKLVTEYSVAGRSAHALTTKPLTRVPKSHTTLRQLCQASPR